MGKLQRPLDPNATEAADENLYAAHATEARPNALYDADGNQLPLDGNNPALQQEWKDQYNKALEQDGAARENVVGGGAGAKAQAPQFGQQPVGCATQQCAKTHWIKVDLVRDPKDRPKWWNKETKKRYPYEPYSAKITDGPKKGALDGSASADYRPIPAGSCSIQFTQFYAGIAEQLDHESFVPTGVPAEDEKEKILVLVGVDAPFAPGVESANIGYNIHNLENDSVTLEIESAKAPGKVIYHYTLSDNEKTSGDGKIIKWDGKANQGALSGKWVGPQDSPYAVRMKAATAAIEDAKQTRVEIHKIELEIDAPKNKIILNAPETNILATSKVLIRRNAGGGVVTPIELDVVFTFKPNGANIGAADSFVYSAQPKKTLGKAGDASAVYWEPHNEHPSTTPDNYNKTCKAQVITAAGAKQGTAKTWFKPSGVGGNKYKVKAEVFASDGTTSLGHKETVEVTIWRKVLFTPYEMDGLTHVSQNGTNALMSNFYTPDIYVEYELGKSNVIAKANSVQYFGLWDTATQSQLDWPTHSAKTQTETPTATETSDANGPAGAARTTARAAIKTKAEAWAKRISDAHDAGDDNWATDANIPTETIIGVDSDHPKFAANSPDADAKTSEWTAFPWLTIGVPGLSNAVKPDDRWEYVQGFVYRKRAYIFKLPANKVARTRVVIAHEVGHATKNQFQRKLFGPGDHTAAGGLMDTTASVSNFTGGEKKLLRGHK